MPRIIAIAVLLTSLLAFLGYCTFSVGQPQIDIQCVEVDVPGLATKYCKDAGTTSSPPPRDGGSDSREQ